MHSLSNEIQHKYQELASLTVKVQLLNDMISWNATLELGEKYQKWVDKHRDVIDELVLMIESDISELMESYEDKILAY